MKKLLLSLIILITSMFVVIPQASAANIFPVCQSGAASNTQVCKSIKSQTSSNKNPITSILKKVIGILGVFIGVISVIVIMVSGLTFITNGSDPQAVNRARNMLIYAIIGIVIAVLAESIVVFILRSVQ